MQPPSTLLPTLHLYRHLLREASYLPPSCSPYIRSQIITRFHKHAKEPTIPLELTAYRIRKAHTNLRTLRAANAGRRGLMLHILYLVYGRMGRRRRKLIAQLLDKNKPTANNSSPGPATTADLVARLAALQAHIAQPSPPPSPSKPTAPAASAAATSPDAKKRARATSIAALPPPTQPDWLEDWDLPALHALLASQSAHGGFASPIPELKGGRRSLAPTEVDIPKVNIWGKPLTPRLARTKLRKWYRSTIKRIMPPLPRAEWEALGVLARGEGNGDGWRVPARRAPGTTLLVERDGTAEKQREWDWQRYATAPVRSLERGQSRSMKARTGEEGSGPYGVGPATGLHRYDRARLWQRLYLTVWQATPVMEEKQQQAGGVEDREWTIRWGGVPKEVPTARAGQMAFFEGIPEGMLKKQKTSRKMRNKLLAGAQDEDRG
ncbi:unnamed protein product [Discula destructiva]